MTKTITNEQWIHGVQPSSTVRHETGVYGTLGCGHYTIVAECGGHGCNQANLHESQEYNARLIAAAPDLIRIAKTLLASWECDPDDDAQYENLLDKVVGDAYRIIAQVEGKWGQALTVLPHHDTIGEI